MTIKAWHFLPEMGKLSHGDERPVVVGETLTTEGNIIPCENGLHASRRVTDALSYRAGPILCRVECSGDVVEEDTKLVCRNRKCLSMHDVTDVLREFAQRCAERALRFTSDQRVHDCVKATRGYLGGTVSKDELVKARNADAYADAAAYAAYAVYAAYAADAADAAYAADAADAAYADAAADAAYSAYAADAADAAYAAGSKARQEERDWQESQLLELLKPYDLQN